MSLALLRKHFPRVWVRGTHSYTIENLQALVDKPHPHRNISPSIADKLGRQLHLQPDHPLNIIKTKIEAYCNAYVAEKEKVNNKFAIFDNLPPIATTKDCFDDLLIPADHVSRSLNDTYYVDENTVSISLIALVSLTHLLCRYCEHTLQPINALSSATASQPFSALEMSIARMKLMQATIPCFIKWKVCEFSPNRNYSTALHHKLLRK